MTSPDQGALRALPCSAEISGDLRAAALTCGSSRLSSSLITASRVGSSLLTGPNNSPSLQHYQHNPPSPLSLPFSSCALFAVLTGIVKNFFQIRKNVILSHLPPSLLIPQVSSYYSLRHLFTTLSASVTSGSSDDCPSLTGQNVLINKSVFSGQQADRQTEYQFRHHRMSERERERGRERKRDHDTESQREREKE